MADSIEDLDSLFDYRRVQPISFVCLDDDDSLPIPSPKKRKISESNVADNNNDDDEVIEIKDNDDEDWLAPPPDIPYVSQKQLGEDSTIKELRLKKQELIEMTKSAEVMLQAEDELVERRLNNSLEAVVEKPSKPLSDRAKIVISIQNKDEVKQFRVYKDDKFKRLFKIYADKVKLDIQSLIFLFDGDKIKPTETPDSLGMEEGDMIEVHVKKVDESTLL